MRRTVLMVFGMAVFGIGCSGAFAQSGAPSYQADPDGYKVVFEDDNFRVIAATWKAGTTDKPHTHPVPSVAYSLTDCTLKIHNADGSVREIKGKAGEANTVPITTQPHRAENPGAADCRAVIVERK